MQRKWKRGGQAEFLIRVGQCLEKGYSLVDALNMQAYQQPKSIQQKIHQISLGLTEGQSLSDSFSHAGFPKDVCSFLYFSEQASDLTRGFLESGKLLHRQVVHRKHMDQVLRYPIFLIWVFGVMIYIVVNQLLPSFQQLYLTLSIQLPFLAQWLIILSGQFHLIVIGLIAFLSLFIATYRLYKRLTTPHQQMKHLIFLPVVSQFIKMYLTYLLSFYLGGLLRIGMSVNEAFRMITSQNYNPFFRNEAKYIHAKLNEGLPLAKILGESPYFLKELPAAVINGEVCGQLGEMMTDYSGLLFERLEEKIKRLMAVIQPALFVFIGILIMGLFLTILLPMFHIMNAM